MSEEQTQAPEDRDEPQDPRQPETRPQPLLRIIRGDPTPEEIAALVAVIAAVGSAQAEPASTPTPAWAARHRGVRRTLPHGPGGWRASALPR